MEFMSNKKQESCRNCKHELEYEIKRCPYCGILNPTISISEVLKTIFAVIVVMYTFSYILSIVNK